MTAPFCETVEEKGGTSHIAGKVCFVMCENIARKRR